MMRQTRTQASTPRAEPQWIRLSIKWKCVISFLQEGRAHAGHVTGNTPSPQCLPEASPQDLEASARNTSPSGAADLILCSTQLKAAPQIRSSLPVIIISIHRYHHHHELEAMTPTVVSVSFFDAAPPFASLSDLLGYGCCVDTHATPPALDQPGPAPTVGANKLLIMRVILSRLMADNMSGHTM